MSAAEKIEAVGKIAGALVAFWGLFKVGLKVHRLIASAVGKDVEARLSLKLDEKLEPVLKELRPNGGTSLADQVTTVLRKLEHHSGRVRAFNRDASEGMFETDSLGACAWVNRTYCRMTERAESEVLGWGWLNIVHPDEVEEVEAHWKACVKDHREYVMTQTYVTPDGKEVLVSVRAQPIIDGNGQLLSYMGFVRLAGECAIPAERCPIRRAEEGGPNAH